jgi:hypothetical protein
VGASEEKIREVLDGSLPSLGLGPALGTFGPSSAGSIKERVERLERVIAMHREALLLAGREIDELRAKLDG